MVNEQTDVIINFRGQEKIGLNFDRSFGFLRINSVQLRIAPLASLTHKLVLRSLLIAQDSNCFNRWKVIDSF